MHRALWLLLVVSLVRADPAQYMSGEALLNEVKRICGDGCIVFSPAEVEQLQLAIVQKMAADLERAYQAGKAASDLTCRNKI